MRSQNSFSERIQRSKHSLKRHRKLVTCLAAVVVFAVTYSLVLPAVTLDEQKAEETPGIETQTKVEEQVEKAPANEKQETQAIEKADAGSKGDASGDSGENAKAQAKSEGSDSSASKDSGSAVKSNNKDSGIKESDKDKSDKDAKESSEDENKLIDEKTELKFDGNGYKIVAEVDADAKLPADTKLKVKEIKDGDKNENDIEYVYDAYCDEALTAVRSQDGEDGEDLSRKVKLYDIKFVSDSSDKDKVEPAAPVKVTIEYDEAIEKSDKNVIRVVHFDDTDMDKDKAAEAMIDKDKLHEVKKVVLETKSEKNDADSMKDVQFKSDRFSVYGLVYTVTKEASEQAKAEEENKNFLTAKDDKYEITVTYDDNAGIPEGAELRVREITEEDEEYKAVQEKAGDELSKKIRNQIPQHPVLFDIAIYDGENEIEPAEGSSVKVEVKMARDSVNGMFTDDDSPLLINEQPIDAEEQNMTQNLQVIHDVKDGELEVVDVDENSTNKKIIGEFETESFSNWLLYLDDEFEKNEITVHVGDSLTLRPYGQWYWKKDGEPADLQALNWLFPSTDYNIATGSQTVPINYNGGTGTYSGITQARTIDNKYTFDGNAKYDRELQEPYWFYHADNLSQPGEFKLYIGTQNGNQQTVTKEITVHVLQGESSQKPGTVEGLSNIKVNLFDYDNGGVLDEGRDQYGNINKNLANNPFNNTINVGHALKFLSSGSGNASNGAGLNDYTNQSPHQGLVNSKLGSDKYPHLSSSFDSSQSSLGYLFDTSKTWANSGNSIQAYPNVTGLFQQDSEGYYYYNSNVNYAEYDKNSNKMILYEHTYTQDTEGSNGANAKPIGFFPFHEYDSMNDLHVNQNKNLNHHLGMSMEVGFTLPSDKLTDDGEHIRYEFSGDDDLWVYVDDDLVLDIGGIHQPVTGYIDFTEGKVYVYNVNGGQPKEIAAVKNVTTGVEHKLRMFYLERGGCDSNLSVKFNLPLIPTASINVAKYDQSANPVAPLQGVKFAVYSDQNCTNKIGDYTSDSNGLIKIEDLQIRDGNTKYYLKETKPLSGYKQDETVYTLVPQLVQQSPKKYEFKIFDGEEEITTIGQNPAYPVLYNEKVEPIDLTVEKQWKDKNGEEIIIPNNASATFKVQRLFKTEYDRTDPLSTIKVYRVNSNWSNPRLMVTKQFKAGSDANVDWTYHEWNPNKSGQYKVDNGNVQTKGSGSAVVKMPSAGTVEVYILDAILGNGVYEQYGVENISVTGETDPGTTHVSTDWAPDNAYNNATNVPTITLPETTTDTDPWKGTFHGLTVLEDKNDGKTYQYKYYIVETNKMPSDSEVVYVDGSGQTVSAPSTLATDSNGTQTIINKVPTGYLQIEKKVTFNNSDQNLTADQKSKLAGEYKFKIYTTAQCGDADAVQDPNAAADAADKDLIITLNIGQDGNAVSSAPIKLVAGNYWIKEVETSNPGMFPVDNPIAVTVTENHTSDKAVVASLTNNYDENNGPDKIAIDIEKKFQGLENKTQVPSDFKVLLQYEVGGQTKTVTLGNKLVTGENGEKITWSESEDGFTWHWKVTSIPSSAKDFKIKEDNYDKATAHDWKSATLNGNSITTTVESYHNLVVTAPAATLSDVTDERRTSDSDSNTVFYLNDDDILLTKLTANQGTLVISKKPLNLAERDAVQKGWPSQGGFKKPPHYFSIEEHPNGFTYGNKTVTFGEKDGRTIVKFSQNASAQEDVFAVSYSSQDSRNNANLVNVYEEVPITVDIVKVDKKNAKKLAGAVFTIRPIKDEVLDDGTLPTVDGKTASDTAATDANGKTSITGLTHGYYEVKEKSAPAGYVMTDDTTFYFKVENGSVIWLEKGTGAPSTWNTKTAGANDMVTFTAGSPAAGGQAATNASFTVKNEPGAALPSAGGPGTTWMYILGSLLTLMAGVTLVARRRMRA